MKIKTLLVALVLLGAFLAYAEQAKAQNPVVDLGAKGAAAAGGGLIAVVQTVINTLGASGGLLGTILSIILSLLNAFISFVASVLAACSIGSAIGSIPSSLVGTIAGICTACISAPAAVCLGALGTLEGLVSILISGCSAILNAIIGAVISAISGTVLGALAGACVAGIEGIITLIIGVLISIFVAVINFIVSALESLGLSVIAGIISACAGSVVASCSGLCSGGISGLVASAIGLVASLVSTVVGSCSGCISGLGSGICVGGIVGLISAGIVELLDILQFVGRVIGNVLTGAGGLIIVFIVDIILMIWQVIGMIVLEIWNVISLFGYGLGGIAATILMAIPIVAMATGIVGAVLSGVQFAILAVIWAACIGLPAGLGAVITGGLAIWTGEGWYIPILHLVDWSTWIIYLAIFLTQHFAYGAAGFGTASWIGGLGGGYVWVANTLAVIIELIVAPILAILSLVEFVLRWYSILPTCYRFCVNTLC